jgi:hypothetical protein
MYEMFEYYASPPARGVDRKIKRLLLIDRVDGLTRNWWPERNTYKIEHDPIIDQKISGHRNANRYTAQDF